MVHIPHFETGGDPMLSSLLRPKKSRLIADRSPFSPVGTRRGLFNERRRATADYDDTEAPGDEHEIEDDEQDVYEEYEGDEDEDGLEESTPLLPIFSAAHLGSGARPILKKLANQGFDSRFSPSVQLYPYHTSACRCSLRDHSFMGSASVSTSLSVPCQAHTAGSAHLTFLESYTVRIISKLFTIQERSADEPWEQRR